MSTGPMFDDTPGGRLNPMPFHASRWRNVPRCGVLSRQRTANG
jgi:hypothetical protein